MGYLSDDNDVWTATATSADIDEAAHYASISLPWTFNRMMMRSSPNGQNNRAFNIAKGIAGQEILHRVLRDNGMEVELPRDSHRDDDLFDIRIQVAGEVRDTDLKTVTYYSNYSNKRPPFSPEYVVENRDYDGPEWRRFFPMMIPHTQMNQDKEVYIFAIAESIDFRNEMTSGRSEHEITAFPHGDTCEFLQADRLIKAREEAKKGVYVSVRYLPENDGQMGAPSLELIGEWDGDLNNRQIKLEPNQLLGEVGPFSCLNSVQMPADDFFEQFEGSLEFSVRSNELDEPVRNTTRRNLNQRPDEPMIIEKDDFCNLRLPDDYTLHLFGWTTKSRFRQNCRKYRSWVWPDDDIDPSKNTPWSQITDDDRKRLERIEFDDAIQSGDHRIDAGFLKGIPMSGGACTYVFPNQQSGGLRETNLYVLPQDLRVMSELGQ